MAACRARARCMRSSHVAYASESLEVAVLPTAVASARAGGGSLRPLSDELMSAPESLSNRLRFHSAQRRNWFTAKPWLHAAPFTHLEMRKAVLALCHATSR